MVTGRGAPGLPNGVVTFVFTDVAGSTALWEQAPGAMHDAMAIHDAIVEAAVAGARGTIVRPRGEGDSRFAVFADAADALVGAADIAHRLGAQPWSTPRPIRVRIAVHTGSAAVRGGDYYGDDVNRCARIRSLAYPGQVLVSRATRDAAQDVPPDHRMVSLGLHRLRDLSRPEELFELRTDRAATFPTLASLDSVPNNLPVQLTSFVGRERDVSAVAIALERHRLVTVTGPSGAGKTRLALQVAGAVFERFPDGIRFVDLSSVRSAELVTPTVAQSLGVSEQPGGDVLEAIVAEAGAQRILVILDNCEHVVSAAAAVAAHVLRATPEIRVLATSQELLGVNGEALHPVGELDASDAVRLFNDRAALVAAPSGEAEPGAAIDQICRALDGIPLAIELAAARTRSLSPAQIAARLDDRFRVLTRGSRTAPDRHQTLRAAVEWSHQLLTADDQAVLRRLSVFAGPFPLDAAEAVGALGGDDAVDVADAVANLIDKSFLVATEGDRYRMLETIRAFGREALEHDGEVARTADAHTAWVLDAVARWVDQMDDEDEIGSRRRMADLVPEIRNAIHRLLAAGRDDDAAGLIVDTFSGWFNLGLFNEARLLLARAMDLTLSPVQAGRVALYNGLLAKVSGRLHDAEPLLVTGVTSVDATGVDPRGLLNGLCHLAALHAELGRHDAAAVTAARAVEAARSSSQAGLAMALDLSAYVASLAGDVQREIDIYRQAVAAARAKASAQLALSLAGLCAALARAGQLEEAAAVGAEALGRGVEVGLPTVVTETNRLVAGALTATGSAEMARLLADSIAHLVSIGVPPSALEGALALARVGATFDAERAARLVGAIKVAADDSEVERVEDELRSILGDAACAAAVDSGRELGYSAVPELAASLASAIGAERPRRDSVRTT